MLRDFELILRLARAAASGLTSKWSMFPSTVKLMIPPFSANPSLSPTVSVLDWLRPFTIRAAWFFTVTGTNTIWHAFRESFGFSLLTSTRRPPTERALNSPSSSGLNGSSPTMHIANDAFGSLNESAGHSTNLVKLYRQASLRGYSMVPSFSEREMAGFKKINYTVMSTHAFRKGLESTLTSKRQSDSPSLRPSILIFIVLNMERNQNVP
jgi:hypothetical protein